MYCPTLAVEANGMRYLAERPRSLLKQKIERVRRERGRYFYNRGSAHAWNRKLE